MTGATVKRRRKGEPVAALALLLACWLGLRAAVWETPFASAQAAARPISDTGSDRESAPLIVGAAAPVQLGTPPVPLRRRVGMPGGPTRAVRMKPHPLFLPARSLKAARQTGHQFPSIGPPAPRQPQLVVLVPAPPIGAPGRSKRWHLDAWAAWRPGAALPRAATGAPLTPAYGGSQAGALARFDLTPGAHSPALYLRATHAPERPQQSDLALGLSIRPIADVPARLWGEARATRSFGRSEVRPAIMAVSELPPIGLPGKLTAGGYVQAGWVGGRNATAFVDGQARIERVFAVGPVDLAPGAGVWGGAQKAAERVDVGPSLGADLRQGGIPLRVTIDYRIRVAGNARPGNGPAVTLSTGF